MMYSSLKLTFDRDSDGWIDVVLRILQTYLIDGDSEVAVAWHGFLTPH